ncbi:hypothetical protein AnigIFM50267_002249 [Aspergillus niger]|nr:hypothetical protein AnigIFM50267_002249 [Aspergillus niger]
MAGSSWLVMRHIRTRPREEKELLKLDIELVQAYEQDTSITEGVERVRGQYIDFANTSVADNIKIGARLASYPIVGQADWISTQLISRLISNGAWRLLVFPGDLREPRNQSRLASFANQSNEQPHLPRFAQRRGVEPVLPPSPDDPGAFQPEDFGKPIGSPRDIPPVR